MAIDRDQSPLVDDDTRFTYAQALQGEHRVVKLYQSRGLARS